jgi:hypothetical protein
LQPAAKQQIPRATVPRFGMTTLWDFSNHTKRLRDERGLCRPVKRMVIRRFCVGRTMQVVHPVRDAPDAFNSFVFGQENPGQLTNELVAMVKPVELGYEPGVFNITNIFDQGHGAYS